jgi:hypothetical protein
MTNGLENVYGLLHPREADLQATNQLETCHVRGFLLTEMDSRHFDYRVLGTATSRAGKPCYQRKIEEIPLAYLVELAARRRRRRS